MTQALHGCTVCGKEPHFGASFNPSLHQDAVWVNFCKPCALNFQSLPPRKPAKWSGQFGGSHAIETLSIFEPFTEQEIEAFRGGE